MTPTRLNLAVVSRRRRDQNWRRDSTVGYSRRR